MFGGSSHEAEVEFERFAAASWHRLRWSAYLLCGDHHLAEDLTQAALARTYSAWSRVRRDDALAYARRTLVNLNIDRMRRRRPVEIGDQALHGVSLSEETGAEDRDEIVRLLLSLGEQERKVVVLRHYYDLSEAAVAAELGLPKGTVKSTLSRALAKLRVSADAPEHLHGRTS